MINNNHSNVPGDHTPAFILAVLFSIVQISTCTVRRRIGRGITIPFPATRIILPPFDLDPAVNENFRRHVMSSNYSFVVPLRGTAKPWLGSNPSAPKLIECSDCHGSDHYKKDCPILKSAGYRTAHGLVPETTNNTVTVASSLSFTPSAPASPNNLAGGSFRGGGCGFTRGGFGSYGGSSRGRGRGGFWSRV